MQWFLYKRIEQRGIEMQILDANGQPDELMRLLKVHLTIPYKNTAPLSTTKRTLR